MIFKKRPVKILMQLIWEEPNTPSLNEWYQGKHWSKRKKLKDEWYVRFLSLLRCHKKQIFNSYFLVLQYNSRLDPSNVITVIKMLEDTMKKDGWIIDDSAKYCRGLTIMPDCKMKKHTYKITITGNV